MAHGINNLGQVVGGSDVSGDQTTHAFLWTPQTRKMKDLGVVGSDFWSFALGINDEGQVVGASANSDFSVLRAFVRQNGVLVDLNTLVAGTTSLFLETACSIDSRGENHRARIRPEHWFHTRLSGNSNTGSVSQQLEVAANLWRS